MKAIIFAAGIGSRLKDETYNKPKALVEIGGKPVLQYAIEKLQAEGVTEIVINVHHFPDKIIEFIRSNDFGVIIHISDERSELLDTGGGLKKAAPLLKAGNDPILLYNVDILSNLNLAGLIQDHYATGALATLVVRSRKTQRYLKFNKQHRLVGWINKKTGESRVSVSEGFEYATEMAFSGIHVVSPHIINLVPPENRFSMIELYLSLARNHFIYGYYDDSSLWMDIGKPESLYEARKLLS